MLSHSLSILRIPNKLKLRKQKWLNRQSFIHINIYIYTYIYIGATAHWIQDLKILFVKTHIYICFTKIYIYIYTYSILHSKSENVMGELLISFFKLRFDSASSHLFILLPIVIESKVEAMNPFRNVRCCILFYIYTCINWITVQFQSLNT